MCVWDENSGKIVLTDGVSLWAGMPRKRLLESLEELAGTPCVTDDPERASVVLTGALSFGDAKAACLCSLQLGRLRSITFHLTDGTAERQRGRLFEFIRQEDPCPDTKRSVRVRYPFGTAWIATDSRSGDATLRITYAVKE